METLTAATVVDSASANDFDMPAPGSPGYVEFRKTGKMPAKESAPAPPKPEAPAAPIEIDEEDEDPSAGAPDEKLPSAVPENAPAPEAGTPQKKDAAARIKQLLEKNKKAEAEREKDRELIRELTAKLTGTVSAKPDSQPVTEAKAPGKPTKPKLADMDEKNQPRFKTYEEYELALDKYHDERDVWLETETLRKVTEQATKTQKEQQSAQAEQVIAQRFRERIAEARKKYADFDEVALNPKLPIVKGSVADAYMVESEHAAEVLYHLGKNPAELDRILKLAPMAQAFELFKIEQTLTAPPVAKPSPAPPITQAPRPPHQVSGKGPAADPEEEAVKTGDQAAYTRAVNDKLLAARRAGRRGK